MARARGLSYRQVFEESYSQVSVRKATEFRVEFIDKEKVPAFAPGGFELRPVDEATLKRYLKGLPEGKKSLAFSLVFRAADRTLKDDEVNAVFLKIQDEIAKAGTYQIRK